MFNVDEYQAEISTLLAILEVYGIDKDLLFANPKISPMDNFREVMLERASKERASK